MFSPSLIAIMFQAAAGGPTPEELARRPQPGAPAASPQVFKTLADAGRAVQALASRFSLDRMPRLPVSARSTMADDYVLKFFFPNCRRGSRTAIADHFWGRVPLNQLAIALAEFGERDADTEFIDLGTTLEFAASTETARDVCDRLIPTAHHMGGRGTPKVRTAVVDLGVDSPGRTPDDFSGYLEHAITANVDFDPHAIEVLSALVERLDFHGVIADIALYCSLVKPPTAFIGPGVFKHAGVVEMQDALDDLDKVFSGTTPALPIVVNLSMGTHVGPHNGLSPIEEFLDKMIDPSAHHYAFCSSGNDGATELAAATTVPAGRSRRLVVETAVKATAELLVEFWYDPPLAAVVDVEIELHDATGKLGPPLLLKHRSGSIGMVARGPFAGFSCESLFHAKCAGSLTCAAFALTSNAAILPHLRIECEINSSHELPVKAWVVESTGSSAHFVTGGGAPTVRAPATAGNVIGVGGVDGGGIAWARTSPGPAGYYGLTGAAPERPVMAHLVELHRGGVTTAGTSFASPRACADAAAVLADAARSARVAVLRDLVDEIFSINTHVHRNGAWDPSTGYGAVTA